jgi:molecular chaperone IbpB/HSP20 family protein
MSNKSFTFDLGRIMDEAFDWAQEFGERFQQGMRGLEFPEELREKLKERFKCYEDLYPHYPYPPANIYLARDKSLIFEIALAGFEERDIGLEFRGDYLYFSARAPQPRAAAPETGEPEEGVQFFKRRLKLKSIEEQRYYVPTDKFEQGRVEARFHNGLLRVTVPARETAARSQGIKVNIASEEAPGA